MKPYIYIYIAIYYITILCIHVLPSVIIYNHITPYIHIHVYIYIYNQINHIESYIARNDSFIQPYIIQPSKQKLTDARQAVGRRVFCGLRCKEAAFVALIVKKFNLMLTTMVINTLCYDYQEYGEIW